MKELFMRKIKNAKNGPDQFGCCAGKGISGKSKLDGEKKGILEGVAYGLLPHLGCIAFIIGTVFGVTVMVEFFKPFLTNQYFFTYSFCSLFYFQLFQLFYT
jgi:hypothetical protein